jgi:hypothetical protein
MSKRTLSPCQEGEVATSSNNNPRSAFHVCQFQIAKSTSNVIVQALLENVGLGVVAIDLEKSNIGMT